MALKTFFDELNQITKLTNKEDFKLWKFQITLKAYGLYEYVEREFIVEHEASEVYLKNDAKAQRIITSTSSTSCLTHVMD